MLSFFESNTRVNTSLDLAKLHGSIEMLNKISTKLSKAARVAIDDAINVSQLLLMDVAAKNTVGTLLLRV